MRSLPVAGTVVLGLLITLLTATAPAAPAADPARPPERTMLGQGVPLDLATNRRGDLVLATQRDDDESHDVVVRVRPVGGAWGTPRLIGTSSSVRVAIDDTGRATVVYAAATGTWAIEGTTGSWSEPVLLTDARSIYAPALAVNAAGAAVVAVWETSGGAVHLVRRPAAGSWEPPVVVQGQAQGVPQAGIDDLGRSVTVWPIRGEGDASWSSRLRSVSSGTDGTFAEPQDLTEWADRVAYLRTAVSGDGDLVATWTEETAGIETVKALVRERDGTTVRDVLGTAASGATSSSVRAHAGQRDLALTWEAGTAPGLFDQRVARRYDAGRWSDPVVVAQSGSGWGSPHGLVGLHPRDGGGFSAVWYGSTGSGPAVLARELWQGDLVAGAGRELVRADSSWSNGVIEQYRYVRSPARHEGDVVWAMRNVEGGVYPPSNHVYHQAVDRAAPPAPTVDRTAPVAQMLRPTSVRLARTQRMDVAWTGSDAANGPTSGVASYDVLVRSARHDGAIGRSQAWHSQVRFDRATLDAVRGTTYCFSVRATDGAGNVGPLSAERCDAAPLDDRDLRRSAGWRTRSDSAAYRGSASVATRRGATMTVPVRTTRVVLTARTCRDCGRVAVSVGSRRIAFVDLRGRDRLVTRVLRAPGPQLRGSLRIRVVTHGRPVWIDALGVAAR